MQITRRGLLGLLLTTPFVKHLPTMITHTSKDPVTQAGRMLSVEMLPDLMISEMLGGPSSCTFRAAPGMFKLGETIRVQIGCNDLFTGQIQQMKTMLDGVKVTALNPPVIPYERMLLDSEILA